MVLVTCRSQSSMLASLIAQMQENADQVEKDILRSEEMLAVVRTLTPVYQWHCLCQSHRQCLLLPPGQWEWKEGPALSASGWDFREAGKGGRSVDGPVPGCHQGQKAQTPAGLRNRERVSHEWILTPFTRLLRCKIMLTAMLAFLLLVTSVSTTSMNAGWKTVPSTERYTIRWTMCHRCPSSTGGLFLRKRK